MAAAAAVVVVAAVVAAADSESPAHSFTAAYSRAQERKEDPM